MKNKKELLELLEEADEDSINLLRAILELRALKSEELNIVCDCVHDIYRYKWTIPQKAQL